MAGNRHVVLFLGETPGETEVAKYHVAVRVYQNVGGLQISVANVGRVQEINAAEQIIEHDLEVLLSKSESLGLVVPEKFL